MRVRNLQRRALVLALSKATGLSMKHCYFLIREGRKPQNIHVRKAWILAAKAVKAA